MYAEHTPPLGATRPHGMVKVGMDTDSPGNVAYPPSLHLCQIHSYILKHAGYDANPSFLVTGFSQLHDDGTGGVRCFLASFFHLPLVCNPISRRIFLYPISKYFLLPTALPLRLALRRSMNEKFHERSVPTVSFVRHGLTAPTTLTKALATQ